MAGDWIKMRVSLVTHPKVLALSEALSYDEDYQDWSGLDGFSPAIGGTKKEFEDGVTQALRVTRYVTVTALLRFWGYANEHAKDEFIASLRVSGIDEIAGIPGFGEALESIGWAVYDEDRHGVSLPNFSEHNATANDRGAAERQRRYRENKKNAELQIATKGDVTRDVTPLHREEKRREDIKTKTPRKKACAVSLPEDFSLTPEILEWAKANGHSHLPARLEHFVGYVKANGKKYVDWTQAFQNAVRDDWAKINGKAGGPASVVRPDSHPCECCGSTGVKRIGQSWYCADHHQYSERISA